MGVSARSRAIMGNEFTRAPLLPEFQHITSMPMKALRSAYKFYSKKMKSQPFLAYSDFEAIFYPGGMRHDAEVKEATSQYSILDRDSRGIVSGLDVFASLCLLHA